MCGPPARPAVEHYRLTLRPGRPTSFEEAPAAFRRRAYGVDYLAIRGLQGGEFYFTRAGWNLKESLVPRAWFDNERYSRIGRTLEKATGFVYLVPIAHPARGQLGMVVKFCRFGQNVGGTHIESGLFPSALEPQVAGAEFSGPFEEFGRLAAFRRYRSGGGRRFRTMIPLGIYCPSKRYAPWQLGRAESAQWRYDSSLADVQAGVPVERRLVHHWDRIYVLLYRWIDGIDLEEAARCGAVTESALRASTSNIAREVLAAGFAVLDHKARHVIVRPDRRTGGLLTRRGELVYALIDYELLVPVSVHAEKFSPSDSAEAPRSLTGFEP